MILRQSTAVAIGGRALLIEGPPGSGKSSLALALIDRGAILVGDDGVSLDARFDGLWAAPAPETAGLIEVRNVGIVSLPTASATVALLLVLDTDAPRFLEHATTSAIEGHAIPTLAFDPRGAAAAVRAEYALAVHGLARPETA